jgi:hypothetical protein
LAGIEINFYHGDTEARRKRILLLAWRIGLVGILFDLRDGCAVAAFRASANGSRAVSIGIGVCRRR